MALPGLITNYTNDTVLMGVGDQVLAQQLHDTQVLLIIMIVMMTLIYLKRTPKGGK